MNQYTNGESLDLETIFPQFFSSNQKAQIAVWILANDQMSLNDVTKKITNFKDANKRKQFENRVFDYSAYRLRTHISNSDEVRQMEMKPQMGLIDRFKEQFVEKLDHLPAPTKHLLRTGIQSQLSTLLFNLKESVGFHQQKAKFEPKAEYLRALIEKIVEKFSKDNEEGLADKIIAYGGIQPVLTTPLFSDVAFKNSFKTIFYNCKTFILLRKYGGKDIEEERSKLLEGISKCLIKLRFNEDTAQQICDELLEKPLSNVVALRDDLTNKQKEHFYSSEFYQSGQLKAYAQILDYQNSLENRVKQDVTTILSVIEEESKNTKETIENVLKFDLYGLLKLTSIRHIKKNVYQTIINKCPAFLKAFKQVKYLGKDPASLKENQRINQKMDLVSLFFKIKLPFEEWDKAENRILSRDYKVIEELTLKSEGRYRLIQHILIQVQPYFHNEQKQMDYKSQVQHALLRQLMDTSIEENMNFDVLLKIINETLDLSSESSQTIEDAGKSQQRAYNEALKKCEQYKEYKANRGRDIKEEQYRKGWQLKKEIYQINFEERIEVNYEDIDAFIQKIITNDGIIPKTYPQYITNLAKLAKEPIKPIEKEEHQQIVEEKERNESKKDSSVCIIRKSESKQELQKKFDELANKIVQYYVQSVQESLFQKHFTQKFGKDASKYLKKLIQTNAFKDPNSSFSADIGLNNLITKRTKTQFLANLGLVASDLNECSILLQKLSGAAEAQVLKEPSASSIPVASSPIKKINTSQLQEQFKGLAAAFVSKYIEENEESLLQRALNGLYAGDSTKLVKAIIYKKAFQDQNSQFFTGLGLNNLLTKRTKSEFLKNGEKSLNDLKRLIEIASLLK